MDDALEVPAEPRAPRWAVWSVRLGMIVVVLSGAGLIWLPEPLGSDQPGDSQLSQGLSQPFATPTPPRDAAIQREFIAPASPTTAATDAPAGEASDPAAAASEPAGPPPTVDTSTRPSPVEIAWTQEEKYALSWLCWYEIRGMGANKVDACLSVISTVRVRYAYNSGFGVHDVISAINAPGQFTGVKIDTTQPSPDADLLWAVDQYQAGARGSCNGYPYFDSVPGGPSSCVIYGPGGQFEEFHSGWR